MMKSRVVVLLALLLGVSALYAAEEKVTMEGTLVSSACYLRGSNHPTTNDMGGKKGCGSYCLRHGDPAGLLTKDKELHILVVSSIKLAPYVGQTVRVTGDNHNGNIAVDKAEVEKDGKWEEIKFKSKEQ